MGEKVQEIRNISGGYKIGEVKNSMGSEEAKELICMTYGHEIRRDECYWERGVQGRGK